MTAMAARTEVVLDKARLLPTTLSVVRLSPTPKGAAGLGIAILTAEFLAALPAPTTTAARAHNET